MGKLNPNRSNKGGWPMLALYPEKLKKLLMGIEAGLDEERLAKLIGTTAGTLMRWFREAEEEHAKWFGYIEKYGYEPELESFYGGERISLDKKQPFHVSLHELFEEARLKGEVENLQTIRAAATARNKRTKVRVTYDKEGTEVGQVVETTEGNDWKAAAWILERRHPEKYGPKRIDTLLPPDIDYETYMIAKALKSMPRSDLEKVKAIVLESKRAPRMITNDGRTIDISSASGNGGKEQENANSQQ